MGGENEEDAEDVEDPGEGVQRVEAGGSVFGDEEIEHCDHSRVAAEHVVSTGSDTAQGHA